MRIPFHYIKKHQVIIRKSNLVFFNCCTPCCTPMGFRHLEDFTCVYLFFSVKKSRLEGFQAIPFLASAAAPAL